MSVQVAAIQMVSGAKVERNLAQADQLIRVAAQAQARLVVLPENFAIMGMREKDKLEVKESFGSGPIQTFLAEKAREYGIWLVGGTIPLSCPDSSKVYASCLMFDDKGTLSARYDKVHLFDVSVPDSNERYYESETICPGHDLKVVATPFGRVGLAVCYDVRFPELFRSLLDQDVEIIVLPSAFTEVTGRAHWETLVRARAVENLCFLIAAGQGGLHTNGRETYGDSMIVNPWGKVLNRLTKGPGLVMAEIDLNEVKKIRSNFPAVSHRKINV